MRVLLSGYYGFQNLGDEVILSSLIEQLRRVDPDVKITVLSRSPEQTAAQFGVQSYQRKSIFQIVKQILKHDVLINGGGSLFQDETSTRSLRYYVYTMRLARLFGKKTASISCGVGPIHSKRNRRLVKKEIEASTFTTLRDPDSFDYLRRMGVNVAGICVSADLAVGLHEQSADFGKSLISRLFDGEIHKPVLALALRSKDFSERSNLDALSQLIIALSADYHLVFLPFYYGEDIKLSRLLLSREELGGKYAFVEEKLSIDEHLSVLAGCDAVVGARLHSLVLSLVSSVPFIGLSYDPKIDSFMNMAGKSAVCNMANFDVRKITDAVNELFCNYEAEKARLLALKESQRRSLQENEPFIRTLACVSRR